MLGLPAQIARLLGREDFGTICDKTILTQLEGEPEYNPEHTEMAEQKCIDLVRNLWWNLREFQREAVIKAFLRNGRMLIGDEMGLGKTCEALAICKL